MQSITRSLKSERKRNERRKGETRGKNTYKASRRF